MINDTDKIDIIIDKINDLEIKIARLEEKLQNQTMLFKIYYTIITVLISGIGFAVGFIIR
jgi:hypothetical protein